MHGVSAAFMPRVGVVPGVVSDRPHRSRRLKPRADETSLKHGAPATIVSEGQTFLSARIAARPHLKPAALQVTCA